MKISHNWLQTYFALPLPKAETLADALTFHAFEIDGVEKAGEDDVLDVKVTPNRGHDCFSHWGIAKEVSAITNVPLHDSPMDHAVSLAPTTDAVSVAIATPLCKRYIAGYVRGVRVMPSPQWLVDALAAMGQRSVNNVVDATNYVMFSIGQPLHAFDADKITGTIRVRHLNKGEEIDLLRTTKQIKGGIVADLGRKIVQIEDMGALVIADNTGPIALAGIKGGEGTSVTEKTKNIIIESANFDGVAVRRGSRFFGIRTDASARFEQVISPELAAYGMRAVADLIVSIAQGEVVGFVDVYPEPQKPRTVSVSLVKIRRVLGIEISESEVVDVFKRLRFVYEIHDGEFVVQVPYERLDLTIAEDLIEEVGRIIGYDKIPATPLPPASTAPVVNAGFATAEMIREKFVAEGYSEVFTSVFADKGERVVANKVDGVRPYLRTNLTDGLIEAHKKNVHHKDLLGLKDVKLFEIGTVWKDGKEEVHVAHIEESKKTVTHAESVLELAASDTYAAFPLSHATRYQSFSKYPCIVRDVACWTPTGTNAVEVLRMIREVAGDLLVRSEKFDEYQHDKTGKTSFAFRLVLQSFDRTLTDEDANAVMARVSEVLRGSGFEIR